MQHEHPPQGYQNGRASPGHRISLGEIAVAVGAREAEVIPEMKHRRGQQIRPTGRVRQAHQRHQREHYDEGGHLNAGQGQEFVVPQFYRRIPHRMKKCGEQHDEDDARVHGRGNISGRLVISGAVVSRRAV